MTDSAPITLPGFPLCDDPQVIFEELIEHIDTALREQPRNLQVAIGLSEIGDTCNIARTHRIAGDIATMGVDPGWKAWVGSRIHDGLADILAHTPMAGRYHPEVEVDAGDIDGTPVIGHSDLIDGAALCIIDWKTKGEVKAIKAAANKLPPPANRVQAHAYGRGWHRKTGVPPKHVMNVYLPRNGFLRDAAYWAEPYNEQIVIDALAECTGIAQLVKAYGKTTVLGMYRPCGQFLCDWCPTSASSTTQPATVADLMISGRAKRSGKTTRELVARANGKA
jgi:hypothetical protein